MRCVDFKIEEDGTNVFTLMSMLNETKSGVHEIDFLLAWEGFTLGMPLDKAGILKQLGQDAQYVESTTIKARKFT